MYGWRGRLGLIVPSTNTVMESEFHKMVPKGVSIHTSRVRQYDVSEESLQNMATHVDRAVDELKSAGVDVVIYGCTSGSFFKGIEWERNFIQSIQKKYNVRALSTSGAVVEALKKIKAKNIVIGTPYKEKINKLEKCFFENMGFNVLNIQGLGYKDCLKIGSLHYSEAYNIASEVFNSNTDAVFISCTDFRTLEVIEKLEFDLDKTIISSNQASFWSALRKIGIGENLDNYGQLFLY